MSVDDIRDAVAVAAEFDGFVSMRVVNSDLFEMVVTTLVFHDEAPIFKLTFQNESGTESYLIRAADLASAVTRAEQA